MDSTAAESFLSQIGITQRPNEQGKLEWVINVITDEAEPGRHSAYFDEPDRVWKFHKTSVDERSFSLSTLNLRAHHPSTDAEMDAVSRQSLKETGKSLTTELSESEIRASKMAEIVPVGIYELSADGSLHWANNQFYEIMGVSPSHRNPTTFAWTDHILPEDHARANEKMAMALLQGAEISDTLRLRRHWLPPGLGRDPGAPVEPFWIMYAASPFLNTDGSTSSLIGSITDISHLKWAEQLQLRNVEAAKKERDIQEEFIDITSHEMRNPLSAITQSADGMLLSLQEAKELKSIDSLMHIIEMNAEAAQSILFCAAHQKRIIDDVLTLGKLDSKLLTIFPVVFKLQDLVFQTMQMFRAEFDANKIQIRTIIDATQAIEVGSTVYGDSSRMLQVLVNLMTNAIKFTKGQSYRTISIRYGMSCSYPSPELFGSNFRWHCTGLSRSDLTEEPEYGQGAPVYVYFAVMDTGEGIPPEALERIFTKFEQADRRTHTKYGGSGLGLYISRELTELQGGMIGIDSKVGTGSTFAFYAKLRHSGPEALQKSVKTRDPDSIPEIARVPLPSHDQQIVSFAPLSKNYNILLVEDNVLNQAVLAKQLKRAGCNVQVCNNGGEAIDIVLRIHGKSAEYGTLASNDALPYYDCILMDWEMPVCDGIQATKVIRKIERNHFSARNLIIGVTANARAEQIAKAIQAGMDSVVPKPFRVAELLVKISDFKDIGP